MEKACERINKAIDGGEKITVFGDYDADGVTSTALLYSYLFKNGANVDYYIPDRAGEGYGMSVSAMELLKERGTSLVITVDNGISAIEEVEKAKELSIDVVVTDHHQAGDCLPDAVAVVDPHRKDCEMDFREWAGVGVAFKLVSALANCDAYDLLEEYGDILAIGTIADIVSLKGENRILVRAGLNVLNEAYKSGELRKGLMALIEASGSTKNMNSMAAAFRLAPRINAAGRMGSAERAIKLLLTDDVEEATLLASEISSANAERQHLSYCFIYSTNAAAYYCNTVFKTLKFTSQYATVTYSPSNVVFATEGWNTALGSDNTCFSRNNTGSFALPQTRHNAACNFVLVDGHVETKSSSDIKSNGTGFAVLSNNDALAMVKKHYDAQGGIVE
jgi:single-stranded-DNA-specific exonuclease RecJ